MSTSTYFTIIIYIIIFKLSLSSASNTIVNKTDSDQAVLEKTSESFSACGGVYIEKQFTLKSQDYSENYPANLSCHYLLKGPHCPTQYQFEFLDFSLESSVGCIKDRLVIGDQDVLCGNENKTRTYFAKYGSLHIIFKTDEDVSGRGYLIRVTRMACEKNEEIATETTVTTEVLTQDTSYEVAASTTTPIESKIFPIAKQSNNHCCGTIYNTKRFIITSPNFPYTLNKRAECSFEIHKHNDNICRLRLNFLFFFLGYTNLNNCPHGFLEIDGKYICGCNSDLKLTTTFGKSKFKVIQLKTDGYFQSYNSGFVLEVIQDECPKKYSPKRTRSISNNNTNPYDIQNDEINKVSWPTDSKNLIEKLHLINERTEILDEDEQVSFKNKPKTIKSIYFFSAPEYGNIPSLYFNKEKTTYLDVSSINYILTNTDYYQCLNWNQIQYNLLNRRYGTSLSCPRHEENAASSVGNRRCVDLNYVHGSFNSPGYPLYYPGNLNICYRLKKQPGYCATRVFVQDFQIESSNNCMKDYFLLANGARHCGNSLSGASWEIDMRYKDHEDMIFVTDNYYCARGFAGVYQQIACQDNFPIYPVDTTPLPSIIPTTSYDDCNKIIRKKSFTIEINNDHKLCTFRIKKVNKNICKINYYFEKFDLVCAVESLVIDGTMYCGHLTGRLVKVNVNSASMNIVYRSTLENKYDALRFKIRGEEVSDDCLFVEVPEVQRLLIAKPEAIHGTTNTSSSSDMQLQKDAKYFIAFVNKNFKDICGIVTNPREKKVPSSFCEILTKNHNATKCMPLLKEISSDVPYQTKRLGIELADKKIVKEIEELEIHEIDCDNLSL